VRRETGEGGRREEGGRKGEEGEGREEGGGKRGEEGSMVRLPCSDWRRAALQL
jgi:hypothetical protein